MPVTYNSVNNKTLILSFHQAATATNVGNWIDVSGIESIQIETRGTSPVGTTTVHGYNRGDGDAAPLDSAAHTTLGTIANAGVLNIDRHAMPNYLKVSISAYTSGTLEVRGRANLKSGASLNLL